MEVTSRALGKSLYIGAGAGALPTANSVLSDVLDIAAGRSAGSLPNQGQDKIAKIAEDESSSAYYLRAQVDDKTGVLARFTEMLAGQGVGIDRLLQSEIEAAARQAPADGVSVALITHATSESHMREAVACIQAMPEVRGQVSLIRVFDGD